jgi:hypothetical protein
MADESSGTAPPTATTKTDDEHMKEWLDRNLISYKNDQNYDCEINIREYLHIANTNLPKQECYLEAASIDIGLNLLTQKWKRKDVCLVKVYTGSSLYHLGRGATEMKDFLIGDSDLQPAFKNKNTRYIVVPVNDGIMSAAAVGAQFRKDAEAAKIAEKSDTANTNDDEEMEDIPVDTVTQQTPNTETVDAGTGPSKDPEPHTKAHGNHWGLLMIDKQERRARFIDSSLTLVNSTKHPGRQRIQQMRPAGQVAGWILCGIERLLGPEKGRCDAKTAKYVPHQNRNNEFKGDPGACCGPYMFAFLEYLYKNPTYLPRLRRTFDITQ